MTRDDVIRLAREARLMSETQDGSAWSAPIPNFEYPERLEHFASLVAAAERDSMEGTHTCSQYCQRPACVETRKAVAAERKACAKLADYYDDVIIAKAIRARGEK